MATINQLSTSKKRIKKLKLSNTPALDKNPQKKGVCLKLVIKKPKKPLIVEDSDDDTEEVLRQKREIIER